MTTVGQVPPQDLGAEESIIGACMISAGAVASVGEVLRPDGAEFYRESHGAIYRSVVALSAEGEPVDAITIAANLDATPCPPGAPKHAKTALDAVGGRTRIHELAALVPASANAAHYARIVRDAATRRNLIRAGGEISRLGWDEHDIPAAIEQAEQHVFEITQQRANVGAVHVAAGVRRVYNRLMELASTGNHVTGVSSGFQALDQMTAGMQRGNLIVVGARPSMGKTALGLCVAANVAIRSGLPVGIFTLEMSEDELIQRLISTEGLLDSVKVRTGRGMTMEDWQVVNAASARIEAAPIYVFDSGMLTVPDIRSHARKLKLAHPNLGLVMVDYLQLMAGSGSEENRVQEVGKISRSLKLLAREIDTPVLALSQLSRGVEGRHDKRPMLSDLRESGAVEQDADVVMFIYRDEYYNPEEIDQQGIAEINIAKQRNGPTDTVKLSFVKRLARFSDIPRPGDMGAAS